MRGVTNTLPFKRLTHNMIMELAKAVVYWLNSIPSHMGVSPMTEFRQPLQVQSHLEMPRILVQLGHTQHT